jgi:hypothetical protein
MRHDHALLAAAMIALTACGERSPETAPAEPGTRISIDIDDKPGASDADAVNIAGDTESGKIELSLPGGIAAKMNVPARMVHDTNFDINGVGLYPGAKFGSVSVRARGGAGPGATVRIGFTTPADAAAVADWYQQQFDARRVAVTRSGDTLTGKTEDGDDFTLAMESAAGGTEGTLTILDTGRG